MIQTSRTPQPEGNKKPASSGVYLAGAAVNQAPLPDVVSKMIALFDGSRPLTTVCAEVQISVGKGLAAVKKLEAQGLVQQVEPSASDFFDLERADTLRDLTPLPAPLPRREPTVRTIGFTPQEEAFFSSEILPIDECDEPFPTLRERIGLAFASLLGCRATAA